VVPYVVRSRAFDVRRWDGITVSSLRRDSARRLSFEVGPVSTYKLPTAAAGGGSRIETRVEGAGSGDVVARVGPIDYPDSYKSPARFINPARTVMRDPTAPNDPSRFEWYCFDCSFRPWADTGHVRRAVVTVISRRGRVRRVCARERDGRWAARVRLRSGSLALVERGGVRDGFGQINAKRSAVLGEGSAAAKRRLARLRGTPSRRCG
jgi:hypothetical protein